jgi:hypothetical protein
LILRKVQLDDFPLNAYTGWICTYNVYDDYGQLRYQIQPEGVKYLAANGWSFAGQMEPPYSMNRYFNITMMKKEEQSGKNRRRPAFTYAL